MTARAEELAVGVAENGDGTYTVASYTVSGGRCECRGFLSHAERYPGATPTCSHVEAIRVFVERRGGK